MNRNVPDHGNEVTGCKRSWEEIDDSSSGQIIVIDDDSDSYTAKNPPINTSIGTAIRYPAIMMANDSTPTEIMSSGTPNPKDSAENSSMQPSYDDDEEYTGMTQSERKRFREKKRRCAITSAVDNLSKVLLKVDTNSLVDRNGTPFGYQSSLNRTGTINRAARVLETLHKENEERKVQVTKLTALLREVSNGTVQFERARPPPPQTSTISQCLTALLSSTQQLTQPPPQPSPFITIQSGMPLQAQAPNPNDIPLSISRSTLENLITLQRQSLEDKLRRSRSTPSGGIQYTTANTAGVPGGQPKIFNTRSGIPSHVPSSHQAMR